jgi:hypothetical protein
MNKIQAYLQFRKWNHVAVRMKRTKAPDSVGTIKQKPTRVTATETIAVQCSLPILTDGGVTVRANANFVRKQRASSTAHGPTAVHPVVASTSLINWKPTWRKVTPWTVQNVRLSFSLYWLRCWITLFNCIIFKSVELYIEYEWRIRMNVNGSDPFLF